MDLIDEISVLSLQALGKLPLPRVRQLGRIAGRLFAVLPSDTRRVSTININLCFPEQSAQWRRDLVRKSVQETIISAFEMGPVWAGDVNKVLAAIVSVEGEEHLKLGFASGKGVMLLAPHLGNWEAMGYYLSTHYDFTAMYQPGERPKLNALILHSRAKLNAQLVPTDKSGVMGLFKRLKKNKLIGILPDQKPDRASGVLAPFFGVAALTQTLGPKLAMQSNAAVVGGVCYRDHPSGGFRLCFFPVDAEIHSDDLATACAAMNRSIESWIRRCPEQYQWEYKRFGRRPSPHPDVYKKRP